MERNKGAQKKIATGAAVVAVALALMSNSDNNKSQILESQINPIPTPPTEMSKRNSTVSVRQINPTPTLGPIPTPRSNK